MSAAGLRMVIVLVSAIALLAVGAFAPLALRRLDAFSVQRVEVVGARHISPADAVAAAGITTGSSIFDDSGVWLAALTRHPLVAAGRIERRVPGTLVLRITEAVPVAFARTPELRAIDASGRVLPADPAAEGMDLPVLTVATRLSAEGRAADSETRALAGFLAAVARHEPALLDWISEAGFAGGAVRLVLRSGAGAEVIVPADADADRLRALHLALADLAAPHHDTEAADGRGATGGTAPLLTRVRRIDVRFHDQIVVALHGEES